MKDVCVAVLCLAAVFASPLVEICRGQTPPNSATNSFVNWETAPVHPVALSPDGNTLAVCNLPDNRLELIDLRPANFPAPPRGVPVGLDPVSVRFLDTGEAWVVNRMSDSVSVVDTATFRVRATLDTQRAPADVAFAGTPRRAFVTCGNDNSVLVFDPVSLVRTNVISIDGERPRAMAVSPDGAKVYVAIFESGNASTILAPPLVGLNDFPTPGVVQFPGGPYQGTNPPPNVGTNLVPSINPAIPTNATLPQASLIVKKDARGRWMDDNGGDWSTFVTGTNAIFSGRQPGWDLPDHDIAVIDAQTFGTSYISGLMNLCMDVAVNPASGVVTVVGTDGINNVRFEPVLKGVFARVKIALAAPSGTNVIVKDLNPHLDYSTNAVAESTRNRSLGDPRGVVWESSGARGFVTGMGSSNLVVIDASGARLEPQAGLQLGSGPAGMALDEARHRLYVLNRFDATISLVDTTTMQAIGLVVLFDPTPPAIKLGRPHFYDTHKSSGLGQASCASCHPDARMDRLAWDLGDPSGQSVSAALTNRNYGALPPAVTNNFHPMKGPMLTQTLQDIIGHEPFHWRGDRDGLEQFNQTFTNLQAAASALTTNEMLEFKNFLATVYFPPNRLRNLDNSLSTNVPLPGQTALGRGALPPGAPLPPGNAQAGLTVFQQTATAICTPCHTLPNGLGVDRKWTGIAWQAIPPGPNGERHLALVELNRANTLPFKIPQLRNLGDRFGADFQRPTGRSGFGFFHDGRVDSLADFIQTAFAMTDDRQTADLIGFLLSIPGSDLPVAPTLTNQNLPPSTPGQDVPASVGRQLTLASALAPALLNTMIRLANSPTSRVDLVARGFQDGLPRGWFFDRSSGQFQSDRLSETLSPSALVQLAEAGHELTFTVVPRGSGRRIGIDRDQDGFFDRDELDLGSNPADPRSVPVISGATITISNGMPAIGWNAAPAHTYRVQWKNSLADPNWSDLSPDVTATGAVASTIDSNSVVALTRYYRVKLVQ